MQQKFALFRIVFYSEAKFSFILIIFTCVGLKLMQKNNCKEFMTLGKKMLRIDHGRVLFNLTFISCRMYDLHFCCRNGLLFLNCSVCCSMNSSLSYESSFIINSLNYLIGTMMYKYFRIPKRHNIYWIILQFPPIFTFCHKTMK